MPATAITATAMHAIPAYAETLRVTRSLGFSDATSGTGAEQRESRQPASPFGEDRFVPGEVPESQRDPGLAAYLRAGKTARGGEGGATEDQDTERELNRLRARDQAVRAHEAAHIAAGGSHIRGGASFTFQTGPDGKQYAIGGEVPIDLSPVAGNPQATISKMTAVRAAALAPAEPSSADIAVANAAAQAAAKAQAELRTERAEELDAAAESPTGESVTAPSTPDNENLASGISDSSSLDRADEFRPA